MTADHVTSAIFVYAEETAHLIETLQNNTVGARITPVAFRDLMEIPQALVEQTGHFVVSGDMKVIKAVLTLGMRHRVGVGIIPAENQRNLINLYDLPTDIEAAVGLALQKDALEMDAVLCNGMIVLFRAVIGDMPMLDIPGDQNRFKFTVTALQQLIKLELIKFEFTPAGKETIETAATGCMILEQHIGNLAGRLIAHEGSITDNMLSMIVSAPISIVEYAKFLARLLTRDERRRRLPRAVGYMRSTRIDIRSDNNLDVYIDGEHTTRTPVQCETVAKALRINVGETFRQENKSAQPAKETLDIDNLPRDKELVKALKKNHVPFFSYASEERFRDLFTALREDARINSNYLVLMLLSTLLATVGLYLNSASVVIGAMLLAPLMAPIVSLAMGLLRDDQGLFRNSLVKIIVGAAIALMAASLIALVFSYRPITDEMQARLNPTLMDLAVAIISGIAAAYSKSFKEMIQSLAGVAIAVALVPPLSVAGIGIARLDFHFFSQAFLLFSTNLVGIVMAATLTFRMLGFSAAVHSKRNLGIVLLLLMAIATPLYISYARMVEKAALESALQQKQLIVNGKQIIIKEADFSRQEGREVIIMDVMTRELLNSYDLEALKKKVQSHFENEVVIQARIIYTP